MLHTLRSSRAAVGACLAAVVALAALLQAPAHATGTVVFSDTFSGPTLDLTKWIPGAGRASHSNEVIVPSQDKVSDGLHIEADKVSNLIYSGSLGSVSQSFLYGRYDIVAKVPKGQGFIPDIWLVNYDTRGQPNGEIDMVEAFGSHTDRFQTTVHDWSHGQEQGYMRCIQVGWVGAKGDVCSSWVPHVDFNKAYHDFGMIWQPGKLTFLLDGHAYFTDTVHVPTQPMRIEIGLGQDGQWDGWANQYTPFPSTFDIKSVTVRSL